MDDEPVLSTSASASLKRFLDAAYAYAFLFDFILCYAIYTALFELEGLSAGQIGALLAFWSLSAVILEVPSGALSDWLDRRLLLIAAPLAKSLTFVCWAVADGNLWLYGLGFFCWSVGSSLYSGTIEAVVYERLDRERQTEDYDQVYGRLSAAESIGIGAGLLLGGFVAAVSIPLSLWLSIPPLLVASVVAIRLADSRRNGDAEPDDEPGYLENIAIAVSELRALTELRFVFTYICLGLIAFEILEEFDQLYYLAVDLPIWLFGVAGAVGLALHALASVLAHRLAHMRFLAWLMPLLAGALLVASAFADSAVFVIVLELAYVLVVPATILAHARFQHLMEGRSRATTTSALEVGQNVTGMLLTLGFGFLGQWLGILPAYGLAGVAMVPIALWVWWRQRQGFAALA